jgi:hypothetical protein
MIGETRRSQAAARVVTGVEPVFSSDPAAVGCERRADVAQLVEHLHGKEGVPWGVFPCK